MLSNFQTRKITCLIFSKMINHKNSVPIWTVTYLLPKSKVLLVSLSLKDAGEQQMTIVVLALPPSDSCKIRVSFESLYGMWDLFPSAKAEMTLPSADSDLLMFLASSSTVPSAPVFDTWTKFGCFNYFDLFIVIFLVTSQVVHMFQYDITRLAKSN